MIVMGVKTPEAGFNEGLRQRLEAPGRAIPGELVGRPGYRRAEFLLEAAAYQGVQAIGGNNQVVAGKLIHRVDRRVVSWRDARRANPPLQDREQIKPADRGEADTVDRDIFAAQVEGDVLPALHPWRDGVDRVGVVSAQEFQRLLGEHHAKAWAGAAGVLLKQVEMSVRMPLL